MKNLDPITKQITLQALQQMAVRLRQKVNNDPLTAAAAALEEACQALAVCDGWLDDARDAEQRRDVAVAAAAKAEEKLAALQEEVAAAEKKLEAIGVDITRWDDIRKDKRITAIANAHLG